MKDVYPRTSREIIARLEKEGWVETGKGKGSHRNFKKDGVPFKITVPHPKKNFPIGTLKKIYKLAGWA